MPRASQSYYYFEGRGWSYNHVTEYSWFAAIIVIYAAMDDCYSYPAIYPGVISGVKVLTAVTCTISIVAACWIIVTYLAFKDLRTAGRQLLLNLSIADILVAGSHFVGVMANYERFIYNSTESVSAHDPLCVSQAAVTMFSSIASFLWTMSIAVYMLAVALSTNQKILKRMVVVIYVISWGVPVPFVVVSAATKTLGFQYTGSTGLSNFRTHH